mgnify:CR=1 FL=1
MRNPNTAFPNRNLTDLRKRHLADLRNALRKRTDLRNRPNLADLRKRHIADLRNRKRTDLRNYPKTDIRNR